MSFFNRHRKSEKKELSDFKSKVYKLSLLMEANPEHLSELDLLAMYPFLFVDENNPEPYLFENTYCKIETYIALSAKVYLDCFTKIKGSKFKREVFSNSYKKICAKTISNMFSIDFNTVFDMLENRYRIYLGRDCLIYNDLQQIILYSQNSDCFVDYDRNTPAIILDGVQDIHLQIRIQALLEGLGVACEGQCIKVAARFSSNY